MSETTLPQTGTESTLSNWAGPYVTDMLGRAEALASQPYTAYTGPLTAGSSYLQDDAFGSYGALQLPTGDQTSFTPTTFSSSMDSYTPTQYTTAYQGGDYYQQPLSTQPIYPYGENMPIYPIGEGPDQTQPQYYIDEESGMVYGHAGGFQAAPSPDYPVLPEGSSEPLYTNISQYGTQTPMELRTYGDITPYEHEAYDWNDTGVDPYAYNPYEMPDSFAQESWVDPANYTQYMSPYVNQALQPIMDEAARQADIQRLQDATRLTQAGAYGGSRQAIMESEANDNLARLQNEIYGTGIQRAYESGQDQFNTEEAARRQQYNLDRDVGLAQNRWANEFQAGRYDTDLNRRLNQFNREEDARRQQVNLEAGRDLGQWNLEDAVRLAQRNTEEDRYRDQFNLEEQAARDQYNTEIQRLMNQFNTEQALDLSSTQANQQYGLNALMQMLQAGDIQRQIEAEGVAADYAQFQDERDYPYRQIQYMQSMLQGLPLATAQYSYQQPSSFDQWYGATSGIGSLFDELRNIFGG
jgi:hypothetical protein